MKSFIAVVAAVAAVAAVVAASPVFAQSSALAARPLTQPIVGNDYMTRLNEKTTAGRDFRESANPLEEREAAKLIAAAGVPCKVIEAGVVSRRGKPSYEVACEKDFGWILTAGPDGVYTPYECLALEASAKAITKGREPATCRLRSNVNHKNDGLQAAAAKANIGNCSVANAAYQGSGGTPPISRYEVLCAASGGYLIDVPTPGSKASLAIAPCDKAATIGAACNLKR